MAEPGLKGREGLVVGGVGVRAGMHGEGVGEGDGVELLGRGMG